MTDPFENIPAAVEQNDTETPKILQNDETMAYQDDDSPLIAAARAHNVDLVRQLLSKNSVNVNDCDFLGQTPLILAAKNTHRNEDEKKANRVIVKLLLAHPGIDINAQDTAAGTTALMYAVITGDLELTQCFVDAGANVNILDMQGNNALHWSVMLCEGDATIVHYLLNNGAVIHRNNAGKTPLDISPNFYIGELLQGKFTSFTHPLEVNFIDASLCPALGQCSIGMTMCPGRQNHRNWSRDLDVDMEVLKNYNTELVVTLMRPDELVRMKLTHLIATFREAGMEIIHFPITDKWLPNSVDDFCALVGKVVRQIKLGKRMVVHCNGGKGRTGLLVVACLIQLGLTQNEATDLIRKVRPGMLRNPAQQVYLMWVDAKLREHRTDHIHNETPKTSWTDFFSGLAGRYFSTDNMQKTEHAHSPRRSQKTQDPTQELLLPPSPRKSQKSQDPPQPSHDLQLLPPSPRRSQKTQDLPPSPRRSSQKTQDLPPSRRSSQKTQPSPPSPRKSQKTQDPPQSSQEFQQLLPPSPRLSQIPQLSPPSPRMSQKPPQLPPSPRLSHRHPQLIPPSPRTLQKTQEPEQLSQEPPQPLPPSPRLSQIPQLSLPSTRTLQKTQEPAQLSQEPPQVPKEPPLSQESPLSQEVQLPKESLLSQEAQLPKESPLSQEAQLPPLQLQTIAPLQQLPVYQLDTLPSPKKEERHSDL